MLHPSSNFEDNGVYQPKTESPGPNPDQYDTFFHFLRERNSSKWKKKKKVNTPRNFCRVQDVYFVFFTRYESLKLSGTLVFRLRG